MNHINPGTGARDVRAPEHSSLFWGEPIRANFRCGDSRGYRSIQEAMAGLGYYGTISPYHVGPGTDRHLTRRREEREEVRLGGATRASRLRVRLKHLSILQPLALP